MFGTCAKDVETQIIRKNKYKTLQFGVDSKFKIHNYQIYDKDNTTLW